MDKYEGSFFSFLKVKFIFNNDVLIWISYIAITFLRSSNTESFSYWSLY